MSERKTEIRSLTGLRGVAALSVALGHYKIGNLVPAFVALDWWQAAAVDLFFCLSGFTLSLAYRSGEGRTLPLRNYLIARIARIYPLYLVTFVLCLYIEHLQSITIYHTALEPFWDFAHQVTMTNAWSVIGSGIHANGPSWSVSVEFFCYLFILPPLFWLGTAALRIVWPVRTALAIGLMAASAIIFIRHYNWFIFICGRDPVCKIPEIAYAVDLLRGVLGFTAGWAIYASFLERDRLYRWAGRHADAIALAQLAALAAGIFNLFPIQLTILGFPLLIVATSSESSMTGTILSWPPLHYLGKISYSVYLVHVPWLLFGQLRTGVFPLHPPGSLLSETLLVGGMLILSALSYHAIEVPARRVIRAAWSTPATPRPTPDRTRAAGWAALAIGAVLIGVAGLRMRDYHPVPLRPPQSGSDDTGRNGAGMRIAWPQG